MILHEPVAQLTDCVLRVCQLRARRFCIHVRRLNLKRYKSHDIGTQVIDLKTNLLSNRSSGGICTRQLVRQRCILKQRRIQLRARLLHPHLHLTKYLYTIQAESSLHAFLRNVLHERPMPFVATLFRPHG